ncbi:hypothetical protein ABK040_001582 [Willaertia magna]
MASVLGEYMDTFDAKTTFDVYDVLEFKIVGAEDLKACDRGDTSDPFVVVTSTTGEEVYKTEVVKKTVNPFWVKESFFHMTFKPGQEQVTYNFELFDWNRFSKNEYIGKSSITVIYADYKASISESYEKSFKLPINEGGQLLITVKFHSSNYGNDRLSEPWDSINIKPGTKTTNSIKLPQFFHKDKNEFYSPYHIYDLVESEHKKNPAFQLKYVVNEGISYGMKSIITLSLSGMLTLSGTSMKEKYNNDISSTFCKGKFPRAEVICKKSERGNAACLIYTFEAKSGFESDLELLIVVTNVVNLSDVCDFIEQVAINSWFN